MINIQLVGKKNLNQDVRTYGNSYGSSASYSWMCLNELVPFRLLPFCLLPFRLLITARCHFAYSWIMSRKVSRFIG